LALGGVLLYDDLDFDARPTQVDRCATEFVDTAVAFEQDYFFFYYQPEGPDDQVRIGNRQLVRGLTAFAGHTSEGGAPAEVALNQMHVTLVADLEKRTQQLMCRDFLITEEEMNGTVTLARGITAEMAGCTAPENDLVCLLDKPAAD